MNYFLRTFLVIAIFLYISIISSEAAEIKYKASDIPADLLKDAKAVVRKSETVIEISDIDKMVMKVTYAITILNENGIRNSVLTQFYDKFTTVRKIRSDLYDQYGVPIKNGLNVEVKDYSANVGYSLYEDNRVKVLDPKYRTLPFTVEYTYEIAFNGLLYYPAWSVYDDYNVSVENSSLNIVTSKGFKFRYLEKNIINRGVMKSAGDKIIYAWNYENMPAVKNEPFGKPFMEYTPVVYSAPSDFEIGGYKGNLDSWTNFGKWLNLLGEGRNVLDKETNEKIKNLVSGISDENEKIKVLYDYLQNKVRYVLVKVGMGGWQSIDAETVNRVAYGDCKALSNYMKSLLDIIGITSYYTLVRAGESAPMINADFPSNQFNHVILCIPQLNDTLWLECTSQDIPYGYLGAFTDDRKALITTKEGGVLVSTRKYGMKDNRQLRKSVVDLSADGSAIAAVKTEYSGVLYDKIYPVLHMDAVDSRKFIQEHILIPSFNLVSFSNEEEKSIIPVIRENLNLKLSNYGTVMGSRILLKPNLMTRVEKLPYRTKDRKSEISIRRPYDEIDTVIIRLPSRYKLDKMPPKVTLTSKFGEYSAELISDNKTIGFIRRLKLFNGDYPVTDYPEFVDFFEKISMSDEIKVALIRDM
ncbi:MAG: DUF3857 domain-containing protein [Bacteroidales bacterium]|nr:DUF3857 domain-containing protein [Bacteroidales bacterium]